jgi:DNA-binding MurR/RpiR family transcriptional regulator
MTRTSRFDDLKDAVSAVYPRLSRQLQQIARFALDRPNELALGTVAGVAEAAGVQPSALIRFANALGFGGFTEMQQVFRERLLERSGSYRERIEQMRRNGQPASPDAGVLHQFVGEAITQLGQLEESVRASDLSAAADLICRAARVHVLAQRRAFPVACYLAYALQQLEIKAHLLDGVGGMLAESLSSVGPQDVLVVASFRNYSQDVIEAARQAHDRGIPVLAITDNALSPLKPLATVCFDLGQDSLPAFRSLVSPLCLAQALVVCAGHCLTAPASEAISIVPAKKSKPAKRRKTPAPRAIASAAGSS